MALNDTALKALRPREKVYTRLREAHLKKDVRGTVCEACVAYS